MRPVAEGDVRVGVAADVEAIGVGEHRLVAVGRCVVDDDLVARGDLLAGELGVLGGGAAELDDRRGVPQHLLDRGRDEPEIGPQPRELAGVAGQRQQGVGDEVAGGVVAGDDQELEEAVQVVVGEPLAVDLRGDDRRPYVVAWPGPLLGRPLARVAEHLDERGQECLRVAVLGIVEPDQRVRPLVEQVAILGGDAEDVGQHPQRHLGGHVGEEVDLAELADRVDDVACVAGDRVGQLAADGLRGERAVDDLAELGVFRRVHVEHHPAQHGDVGGLGVAQEAGALPGREDHRTA